MQDADQLNLTTDLNKFYYESFELIANDENKNKLPALYALNCDKPISYADLYQRVMQFANYLLIKHPDVKNVGLFLSQSVEYTVCFLALHFAGKVLMPLSPDHDNTADRLASFVNNGQIELIISTSEYSRHPFLYHDAVKNRKIIFLDKENSVISSYSKNKPTVNTKLSDLAYFTNTSGSSGKPKQLRIPHTGIYALMIGHIKTLNVIPQDRIAAFADIHFDAHIAEIVTAVGSGASLYIVPADYRRDLTYLSKFYSEHKITVAVFVASMLKQCNVKDFPHLRIIICTGEKQDDETLIKWTKQGIVIIDGYGPAENTVATYLKKIEYTNETSNSFIRKTTMHIIPGTEIFVLPKNINFREEKGHIQQVSNGIEGEIYLAGKGIAAGYINQDMTRERFFEIQHPDNPHLTTRVFKSNDLAIRTTNGEILIQGRVDRQLKIYGKLICPEEIEITINEVCPEISIVIIDAQVNREGHPDFICYLQPKDITQPINLADIYHKVANKLGPSFIPTRWIIIEKIPLLPSLKPTLLGLPPLTALKVRRIQGDGNQLPGEDLPEIYADIEKKLAQLFLDILIIPEPDFVLHRNDNFFELGGKSLQAIILLQMLRQPPFNLRLRFSDFLLAPTVEQLTRLIMRQHKNTQIKSIIPLYIEQQKTVNVPVFFIHSLLGDVEFDSEKMMRAWNYPHSVHGISARGITDPLDMDTGLMTIAMDYFNAIKKISPRGPKVIAGWSLGGILSLLVKQLFLDEGQTDVITVMIDSESPTIFQNMTSQAYSEFLNDLLMKKIAGQIGLKEMPITTQQLGKFSKEEQIYHLIMSLEKNLAEPGLDNKKRLLKTVKGLLLGILKVRLEKSVDGVHLIAASETQQKHNSDRLQWPSLIKLESLISHVSDHDSIMLTPANSKIVAQHLYNLCIALQDKLKKAQLLDALRAKKIDEIDDNELRYYIPQHIVPAQTNTIKATDADKQNVIHFIVEKFLRSDQLVLTLFANAGEGKTTCCNSLARRLQQEFVIFNKIVLYITLAHVENPLHRLIETHLENMGFSTAEIQYFQENFEFVIIIEGRDENNEGLYQNLYVKNQMNKWKAQVIYSVRSTYKINAQDYQRLFYPLYNNQVAAHKYSEITLDQFDDNQIDNFVRHFMANPPPDVIIDDEWRDPEKCINYIKMLPNMRVLARNPFLLRVLLEVLARIVRDYESKPLAEREVFTQLHILEPFVNSLWERQANKLMIAGNLPDDGRDVIGDFENYCINLAKAMKFYRGTGVTQVLYKRGEQPWEEFFGNSNPDMVRAREGCPLKFIESRGRNGVVISWLHSILIEYFVTRSVGQSDQFNNAQLAASWTPAAAQPMSTSTLFTNPNLSTNNALTRSDNATSPQPRNNC